MGSGDGEIYWSKLYPVRLLHDPRRMRPPSGFLRFGDSVMPIRKEDKALYPKNWKEISLAVKREQGWICRLCDAAHGCPHPKTRATVVLTTAHLDGNPANWKRYNLMALCQRCHNRLDGKRRGHGRAMRNERKRLEMADALKLPERIPYARQDDYAGRVG